jgi:acyl-CoA synthetase (AMP-forming)/AMP-acid ligase II
MREAAMTVYAADTIAGALARGAEDAPAIGMPQSLDGARPWLTHGALRALTSRTVADLNRMGIGRNDRVAIVLPNGPEMATSFLAVACAATTAPLNPGYRRDEFEFYLSDLNARALVILRGMESPAREVAAAHDIPVIELVPDPAAAGAFTLMPERPLTGTPAHPGPAEAQDVALVLHTSGTTSRPKIVPLRHINVTASAYHIGETLALTPADARPSWYTAVPTMHQAILALAPRNREVIAAGRLRFIRSSSSSLPPQVMAAQEEAFGVPVIEAYGMTEASHQMCSNPLPPRVHVAGSVGLAAGPEVAIMDEAGTLLPPGTLGEVVIRGRNVTAGYENNPAANASAFTNGWFRTGDQGTLDEQGYLRLTGRLKEIINRGGEKISPLEVDVVLMDHPAVQQVVTFGMPHSKLGEEVAACVVLREGHTLDEHGLRDFAAERLAQFKVPRRILFMTEIPKGATGKLQRIGLAAKLGLSE